MEAKKLRIADLTPEDLERLTADLDDSMVADKFGPLNANDRQIRERAKRKRGRPLNGKGAAVISISVEKSLLAASDKLVKRKGITRSNLIARGLRAMIASEGLAVPASPATA